MPEDQNLDHLPLPPKSDESSSPSSPLTDPVAPDISAPPKTEDIPVQDIDKPENEIETKPESPPQKTKTEPEPELKLASAPKTTPKTLFTIIFLLLTIAGISTAFFLYTQNNQLKDKVANLNTDIQKQEIAERSSLPSSDEDKTTTEETTIATSSTSFSVPTTTPTPITISTTDSPTKTFSIFTPLFELATSKYPNAQLLLISATNLQQDNPTIKYYFRQEPDKVKYFYIINDTNSGLNLFDEQVWVSPDNNIPSLNDRAKNNQLGADLDTVLKLTNTLCSEKHSNCDQATSIKAQLIDSNVTLWQITYQLPNTSSPLVYQINSQTQSPIFRSDN